MILQYPRDESGPVAALDAAAPFIHAFVPDPRDNPAHQWLQQGRLCNDMGIVRHQEFHACLKRHDNLQRRCAAHAFPENRRDMDIADLVAFCLDEHGPLGIKRSKDCEQARLELPLRRLRTPRLGTEK